MYLVIMNAFTMKTDEMKDPEIKLHETKWGREVAKDDQGRLYSVGLRELMSPLQVDLSAVEALSALRFAARSLHLLQERWADKHDLTEGRMGVLFRLYRRGDCPLGDL